MFILAELNSQNLKYLSLVTLTVQNSAVSLCMRYAKTRDGDIFFSSTGKLFDLVSPENSSFFMFSFSRLLCRTTEASDLFSFSVHGGRNSTALQSQST